MRFFRENTRRSDQRTVRWHKRTLEVEVLEQRALPSTFTVINTNDSGPGSLRQAILDSNSHAGLNAIQFQIASSGVQTITPLSAPPPPTPGTAPRARLAISWTWQQAAHLQATSTVIKM